MIQPNKRFAACFFKGWWKEQVPDLLRNNKMPTSLIGEHHYPGLLLSLDD
jgi:hypothetical protein